MKERYCRMCGNEIESNRCRVCGYYDLGRSRRANRVLEMQESMREYRKVKLPDYEFRVSLIGYRYRREEDGARLCDTDGEVILTLPVNEALKKENCILWDREHPFAQTEGLKSITLTCEISDKKGASGEWPVRSVLELPAPKTCGPWYVGIALTDGYFFHLYVGDPDAVTELPEYFDNRGACTRTPAAVALFQIK